MAGATIKVKDADDGKSINMDIEFNPEVDNNSMAHRIVQRFIEFINTPSLEGEDTKGRETETLPGS